MIDTHCHLDMFPDDSEILNDRGTFEGDSRDAVILRARDAGVEAILTVSSDFESNNRNTAISEKYDFVYASVGMHPHDAKDFTEDSYRGIAELTKKDKVVAIGETGLDYHYDHSPRDIQKDIFRRHLALARETGLPIIVHSREAKEDTLEILGEAGISRGVLHCFSGDRDMAEKAVRMGLSVSIAGPVTFRNAENLREIVAAIPDEHLLVETDAPFLAPDPVRGKRNEPAFLIHTIRKIAELRGVHSEDVVRITTLNARRLFRIGEVPDKGEIAYRIRDSLYLNVTNRCTNHCSFCVKFHTDYVKGHNLRISLEPTEEELKRAIGDPSQYHEIVFCGYGEPFIRLDTVKNLGRWIKDRGGNVRVNTNGHGNLIHKRNIVSELQGIVDAISVSLDAQDEETYNRICSPLFKNAFPEIISFLREAKKYIPRVQATVVEMDGVDIERCRKITDELGIPLTVRRLDVVG
ncbi:MAG TPA: YchF/TatD family DNA exonuclease [Thermodesulfovibrionales bacterium]|nr:YchF/TatD family DNA exonuclease [Thermodesulfovibrionales bacterium]